MATKNKRIQSRSSKSRPFRDGEERITPIKKESDSHADCYQQLVEDIPIGFAHCKMMYNKSGKPIDFIYLDVNKAYGKLTGLREVIGKKVTEVLPGVWQSNKELFEIYGRVASSGMTEHFERYVERLKSWLNICVHSPEKEHFVVMVEDITERKQAEESLHKSEDRFRRIVEQAPMAMAVVGMDGTIEFINRKAVTVFGYLHEDIPTMDRWWVQAYPDEVYRKGVVADWTGRVRKALTEGSEIVGNEYRVTCKDGTVKTMFISGVPVSSKIFVMFDDITERKQAEEALRESEQRFSTAFKTSPYAYIIANMEDGRFIDVNEAFTTVSGYSREEALASSTLDLKIWVDEKDRRHMVETLRSSGAMAPMETKFRGKNGNVATVLCSARMIQFGQRTCILSIMEDITERKKSEEALRESEERFSRLTQASFEGVAIHDKGLILDANQAMADLFGYELSEFIGLSVPNLAAPESRDLVRNNFLAGYEKPYEAIGLRKNGTTFVGELRGKPITYKGRMIRVTAIRDITERKRAEQVVYQSEQKYRDLANSLPLIIFELDPSGLIIYANRTAFEWFGYSEAELAKGINVLELIVEEDRNKAVEKMRKVISLGERATSQYFMKRKDGSIFPVLATSRPIVKDGKPVGIRGTVLDITERQKYESVLNNAQKLESLGLLAGGIAHDFNNLLTGIFGYIDLARSSSKDAKTAEYLEATLAAMSRARSLTLQLLTFAKGGFPLQKITPVTPFIEDTARFALSGSNISCKFLLAKNLWPCNIDKDQIGQVIDNIVINAQQAMPNGGDIEITAQNISFGEKEHPPLTKGDYVKVSIKDHGIGIAKNIMPRIFDPFYTTKTKGHGLGLATCYSIITRHDGCIEVESEQGKGSTFNVYLPASAESVVRDAAAIGRHKGSGTIVVMDDEEVVRDTLRHMLASMGYTVVCRNDGKAAVDFYAGEIRANRQCSAMIFDLTVPGGTGGIEAVKEIRKLNAGAEITVFVASGYTDDPVMKNPTEYGFTASISKPFTMAELSEMLNKNMKH